MEEKCPDCCGTGIDRLRSGFLKHDCQKCNGSGRVEKDDGAYLDSTTQRLP